MGKILLIEDDGAIAKIVKEKLSDEHEIKHAYSYSSALGFWEATEKKKEEFDCIILDLNIVPPKEMDTATLSRYYPIQGILLLKEFYRNQDKDKIEKSLVEKEKMRRKTVVFSAYIDELEKKKNEIEGFDELKKITKMQITATDELLKMVKNILDRTKQKKN